MKKTRNRLIKKILTAGLAAGLAALLFVMSVCAQDEAPEPDKRSSGKGVYNSLEELSDKTIAVQSGTIFDNVVRGVLPEAKIKSYPTYADMIAAVKSGKADALPGYRPILQTIMAEDDELTMLDEETGLHEFGFIFAKDEKGKKLRDEVSAYIDEQAESGALKDLQDIWLGTDETIKSIDDYTSYPAPNGTLVMASEGEYRPFDYFRDGKPVGYEIALAADFCKAKGYRLEIQSMNFSSILPAVQTHKVDFGCSGISITEERKETLYFSSPTYSCGTAWMVLKAEKPKQSFFSAVAESFQKTFIKENRYNLFLKGIGTTLLIGVLSLIFGTLLGFLAFLWCRNGNPFANAITRFLVWIVQVMPAVVLLMILYYIVFGKASLSSMWVAVIGFTLTFGASAYNLIKSGVSAVDKGQAEAAGALGFTDRQTFFGIVLPQAVQRALPAFKGAVISLIKGTSIVGYIAVQDLTKMGDYVRSRTYEAFFPLIAVAIVYFILAAVLSLIVSRIGMRTDPKQRTAEQILKGVKTHD